MKLELPLPVWGLLLCVASTMAQDADPTAQGFEVAISKMRVSLTCPLDTSGMKWKKEGQELRPTNEQEHVIEKYDSSKDDGEYQCESGKKSIRLHLKVNVCETCEELDVLTVAGVIIADLLITLGVLVLVYYFSKNRKGRVGGSAAGRPRGQKMARPPPVPNPDYEPIRKGQREVYAGLESRGF
ncbi:T-cell surface glycoprotein CD3 epsilon chain [Emydura macquarii macquarii]|uniref:T-cell surface glycoprotein CD3 epsilon chain n=1 Tax=Emydura macquarii macquarii TaxID=1129001 RepID=UPI00352A48AB